MTGFVFRSRFGMTALRRRLRRTVSPGDGVPADGVSGERLSADGTVPDRVGGGEDELTDLGMSTAEYAVGTVAAVAFAAVLFKVVHSAAVQSALGGVITSALHTVIS